MSALVVLTGCMHPGGKLLTEACPSCCRTAAWTVEDAVKVGKDAGEQLRKEAGEEFFDWARQSAV